jgi:hypothetical protein
MLVFHFKLFIGFDTAYLPTDRPSTVDGRPVHRPVPSSIVRDVSLPYRRRTVPWTAGFGTVRRPGRTVTIPRRAVVDDDSPGAIVAIAYRLGH